MTVLPSFSANFCRRWLTRMSLPALFLIMVASGCSRGHDEAAPDSPEAKRKKMGELTEEMHRVRAERNKLDEELKEKEHKYATIRASSLTALIGYVKRDDLHREVQLPGTVKSYEATPIFSYIPGIVEKIAQHKGPLYTRQVDMGDFVKKGEILAVLGVPEREADVERKKAIVFQMQAELIQANEMLRTAKANVKTTETQIKEEESVRPRINAKYERWKSEDERIEKLYKDGVIDKQIRDETHHQFKGVEGELGEVEAKILRAKAANEESIAKKTRAEADVDVANSRIVVATADQKEAQDWLNYREIRAPFDGRLTERTVHTGYMIKPGQEGEKGVPLFNIIREDIMRVVVDVGEAETQYVKVGSPGRIHIDAQQYEATGTKGDFNLTVTRISHNLNQDTRTLRVEFQVDDNAKCHLRPGMYAYAYIPIDYKGVWSLPETAIKQTEEQGSFIFRDVDGKAVLTPVKTGIRANNKKQLLKYRDTPANPDNENEGWREFTGQERIIMNPIGFVDGVEIKQSEMAK